MKLMKEKTVENSEIRIFILITSVVTFYNRLHTYQLPLSLLNLASMLLTMTDLKQRAQHQLHCYIQSCYSNLSGDTAVITPFKMPHTENPASVSLKNIVMWTILCACMFCEVWTQQVSIILLSTMFGTCLSTSITYKVL